VGQRMRIVDTITIDSTADAFFDFFERMDEHYLQWHPDHQLFRWVKGRGVAEGVEFYFEEIIGGKLMKKHVVFTRVESKHYLEFTFTNRLLRFVMPRISFRAAGAGTRIEVTAEIHVRTGPVGAWLNRREFAAVRRHMREEGENLKRILESAA
jgi:hypothetical protein